MQKVFIGLLVGICVIMFALPLMAADSPKGLELSTLQSLDDAQLSQIRGKMNVIEIKPPPAALEKSNGIVNAYQKNNLNAHLNSRVFSQIEPGLSPEATVAEKRAEATSADILPYVQDTAKIAEIQRVQASPARALAVNSVK